MSRSNLTDVTVIFIHETEKAIGVQETEDGKTIWLPKSQVEYEEAGTIHGRRLVTITLPEYLAQEKELI